MPLDGIVVPTENPVPDHEIFMVEEPRYNLRKGNFLPFGRQISCTCVYIPGPFAALHTADKLGGTKRVKRFTVKPVTQRFWVASYHTRGIRARTSTGTRLYQTSSPPRQRWLSADTRRRPGRRDRMALGLRIRNINGDESGRR